MVVTRGQADNGTQPPDGVLEEALEVTSETEPGNEQTIDNVQVQENETSSGARARTDDTALTQDNLLKETVPLSEKITPTLQGDPGLANQMIKLLQEQISAMNDNMERLMKRNEELVQISAMNDHMERLMKRNEELVYGSLEKKRDHDGLLKSTSENYILTFKNKLTSESYIAFKGILDSYLQSLGINLDWLKGNHLTYNDDFTEKKDILLFGKLQMIFHNLDCTYLLKQQQKDYIVGRKSGRTAYRNLVNKYTPQRESFARQKRDELTKMRCLGKTIDEVSIYITKFEETYFAHVEAGGSMSTREAALEFLTSLGNNGCFHDPDTDFNKISKEHQTLELAVSLVTTHLNDSSRSKGLLENGPSFPPTDNIARSLLNQAVMHVGNHRSGTSQARNGYSRRKGNNDRRQRGDHYKKSHKGTKPVVKTCYSCGSPDHLKMDCPKTKSQRSDGLKEGSYKDMIMRAHARDFKSMNRSVNVVLISDTTPPVPEIHAIDAAPEPLIIPELSSDSQFITALLDTGCQGYSLVNDVSVLSSFQEFKKLFDKTQQFQ